MTDLDVPLKSILPAFRGVIPSPVSTCSPDGTPNLTYVSSVWYVDEERIAFSNQFLGKTMKNLEANPLVTLRVVDSETLIEYDINGTFLASETAGDLFEVVRTHIDAIAAQTGMEGIFRLRSVEMVRVDECRRVQGSVGVGQDRAAEHDALEGLSVFVRRLDECHDLAEVTRHGLHSIEDLFGFSHSMLLRIDESDGNLFVLAHNGYGDLGVGAEVPVGDGVIGIAAQRRRQVLVTHMTRSKAWSSAATRSHQDDRFHIKLPGLEDAQSLVASPLVLRDRVIGILFLDSAQPDRFDAAAGHLVEILAGHLAAHIGLHEETADEVESVESATVQGSRVDLPTRSVRFYDQDGTVLVDGDYVIKGVAGRILFAMLDEHERSGRSRFTNRELRLNNEIGLPPGNDNLEARLLALRRRLEERDDPFRLERVGRGQLELRLDAAVHLHREGPGEPKTLL